MTTITARRRDLRTVFETDPRELLEAAATELVTLVPRPGSPTESLLGETIRRARAVFISTADPRGVFEEIEVEEFDPIYRGRGGNLDPSPVPLVVGRAEHVALFVVTLGAGVSERIRGHFASGELAEGYLLDQIASFAADALASEAARRFAVAVSRDRLAALPYSPGYCGWALSGQHALFDRLQPVELEVTLNDSDLMDPIKSVSGVLVAARAMAHDIRPDFPCCSSCESQACRSRIAALKRER